MATHKHDWQGGSGLQGGLKRNAAFGFWILAHKEIHAIHDDLPVPWRVCKACPVEQMQVSDRWTTLKGRLETTGVVDRKCGMCGVEGSSRYLSVDEGVVATEVSTDTPGKVWRLLDAGSIPSLVDPSCVVCSRECAEQWATWYLDYVFDVVSSVKLAI